jgi:hypothetical protein
MQIVESIISSMSLGHLIAVVVVVNEKREIAKITIAEYLHFYLDDSK